jgi:hypothetical protein
MEFDYVRADKKKGELVSMAEKAVLNYWQASGSQQNITEAKVIAAEMIEQYAYISPPEKEDLGRTEYITLNPVGRAGGRSIKPGNVRLNMRKLIVALAGGVLTVAGVVSAPWTIPFAAIMVWDGVWSAIGVDITERDAAVLWTMWKHRDANNYVSEDGLLSVVNAELTANGRRSISQIELDESLELLSKISCIERAISVTGKWWLKEWVKVNYR